MAKRMVSSLDGSESTIPMPPFPEPSLSRAVAHAPITERMAQVPYATESHPPGDPSKAFLALPSIMLAVGTTAAIWAGLALFLLAFTFHMPITTQVILAAVGLWLLAVGTAFVMTSRPDRPIDGFAV